MDRADFFAQGLPSTDPTLCYGEIQVSTKLRVLPFGTSSWIPDLENFATAYRSSKRVINLARQRRTLVVTRRSAAKVALPLELRRSTAVVYHSDRIHSVYTTIPSRGSISDSWYLCRRPISAFGPSYRYAKFHRNQCSSFHDTSIHARFLGRFWEILPRKWVKLNSALIACLETPVGSIISFRF